MLLFIQNVAGVPPGPSSSVHKGGLWKARSAERVGARRTQKSTSGCGHFTDGSAEAGADRARFCRHFPNWQRYFPPFFKKKKIIVVCPDDVIECLKILNKALLCLKVGFLTLCHC